MDAKRVVAQRVSTPLHASPPVQQPTQRRRRVPLHVRQHVGVDIQPRSGPPQWPTAVVRQVIDRDLLRNTERTTDGPHRRETQEFAKDFAEK